MQSPSREQLLRTYDALNRGDLDVFLEGVHPEVTFRSLVAEMEGEEFRGHAGVRKWFARVAEALGGLDFSAEDVEIHGDAAVVRVRVEGSVTGVVVEQRMWQAVRFRDGKAIWWRFYRAEAEARAAIAAHPSAPF